MASVTVSSFSRSVALLPWLAVAVAAPSHSAVDPELTTDNVSQTVIRLKDGSQIVAAVKGMRDGKLELKTSFADKLKIKLSLIDSLNWLNETKLLLKDESVKVLPKLVVDDGVLRLAEGDLPLADVAVMNPKAWEEGDGYHWVGKTGAAFAYTRGNTQTDQFDMTVNTQLESTQDRYTVDARFENDVAYNLVVVNGEQIRRKVQTADNWKLLLKYDYFLENSDNYIGVNASVEADALAGVDMRTYAGPYFGRKLLKKSYLTLDGEIGASYVSTEYAPETNKEDFSYTGLNWNLTGESDILGGDSKIFLRHVGLVNVDAADELILKTTAGLSFPLLYGLEGSAEFTLNYDGTAAANREEIDEVYRFRVGYAW